MRQVLQKSQDELLDRLQECVWEAGDRIHRSKSIDWAGPDPEGIKLLQELEKKLIEAHELAKKWSFRKWKF